MAATTFSLMRALTYAQGLQPPRGEGILPRKNKSSKAFSSAQAKPLLDYLLSPYENGYWELKAKWKKDSDFAKLILDKLGISDVLAAEGLGKEMIAVKNLAEERRDHLLSVTSRISSVNALFRSIVLTQMGKESPRLAESDEWVKEIDGGLIQKQYEDAYKIFSTKIFYDSYLHSVGEKKIYAIQSGLVICMEGPT